ncbi:hypothetical protein, partial [Pseudomonas syringae group genomosp. 7]|uniref:hypothetical protein n=1 Tax=Pseudomonas syringae group genomosp. 7 TaxID=251699 RepID=UPI00376F8E2B
MNGIWLLFVWWFGVLVVLALGVGFVCGFFGWMRFGAVRVLVMARQRAEDMAALCGLGEPVA